MRTEKEKMLAEEPYNAADPQLVAERLRARELCLQLNNLSPYAPDAERQALVSSLFGAPTNAYVTPPFACDYGSNVVLGDGVYFNFNCVILDVARVVIGNKRAVRAGGANLYGHPSDGCCPAPQRYRVGQDNPDRE